MVGLYLYKMLYIYIKDYIFTYDFLKNIILLFYLSVSNFELFNLKLENLLFYNNY